MKLEIVLPVFALIAFLIFVVGTVAVRWIDSKRYIPPRRKPKYGFVKLSDTLTINLLQVLYVEKSGGPGALLMFSDGTARAIYDEEIEKFYEACQ